MTKYALFLGCLIPLRFPNIEVAARKVFEKLGVQSADLVGYSCCPDPVISRLIDKKMWLALSARNLSLAEEKGLDLLTLCNGCYETLWEADEALKHDYKTKREINAILAHIHRRYQGKVKIKHAVEVLYEDVGIDEIQKRVVKPLRMKVAIQYGCHLFRSPEGEDIWKKAKMTEELVKATGAEVISSELDRLCCGFPTMEIDEEFTLKERALPKLKCYDALGVECIVTPCPACNIQFEVAQTLLRKYAIHYSFPCMHVVELLALALGVPAAELHLEFHRSPVPQLIERLGG